MELGEAHDLAIASTFFIKRESQKVTYCSGGRQNEIDHILAKEFQYLDSVLSADGTVDAAVRGRIACAWLKWRESTGILCDRRCSRVLKGKIYRTVLRPAMMYGGECWPLSKTHERMLNTAEMRMLRWACGLMRCDKVHNEDIRTMMQTASIQPKNACIAVAMVWSCHEKITATPYPAGSRNGS
ncbi:hypothetical protein ANCDUO_05151 [Ancylostoma duodenale]|uniref:Uncharacterized protein n=1 Tax=Ancylostoma duodenale TaxID=51022 RepID=A0A0C2GZA3_9BILA|nr:hypothetical protein ANCDUO_05151 [Ancylostoma duodenale]